ncbi:MAG: PAS domain S-box protein, partial [Clostridia bacterium]|nr:PAS domain S-box protein [Clostridia bacterium]
MDMPKQQADRVKKRVKPVHLLEFLVCLAHLASLVLIWWIRPRVEQDFSWLFLSLIIATAIPLGPVAGLVSGFGLALAESLATLFRDGVAFRQIFLQLPAQLSGNWTHLAFWPLAGLLAGLYATRFSRSSRRQARKAWELARTNEQLKIKVSNYEECLGQVQQSGDWMNETSDGRQGSAQLDYLSNFLYEALALRTHSLTSLATRQAPDSLPEALFDVITQSCPATLAIIDSNGTILHSHRQVLAIFGFTADLTRPGRPFDRLLTVESAELMHALFCGQSTANPDSEPKVLSLALSGERFGKGLLVPEIVLSSDTSLKNYMVRLRRSDLHATLQLGWPVGETPASLTDLLGPEGCCLAPDGTITYISATTASKLGESALTLQGHKLASFVSNDSMDTFNQVVRDCRNGLASRADLVLYPYGRKGNLHYQTQVFPSLDQAGNLVAMTVRLFDLTSKKQTESMLSRRLDIEQMIALISSRFIAVKTDGLEREIISVLRLVCEFENALECSIEMVPSSYFRRRISMCYQNENRLLDLQTASSSQISDRFETIGVPIEIDSETVAYVRIKQDKYRDLWVDSDLKLIRLIGEIIVNAQIRSDNIQSIKLNERRLATTLHSIGEGVIATDPEGHIILMNRRAEQMTGWTWTSARNMDLGQVFNPAKAQVTDDDNNRWTIRHLRPLSETDN